MDDLISRAALLNDMSYCAPELWQDEEYVKAKIMKQPTVDAAPVVRCKKCVHWLRDTLRQNSNDVAWWNEAVCDRHSYDGLEIIKKWTSADFYCADGERRDDDGKAD